MRLGGQCVGLCGVGRIRIPREGHFGIFEPATGHPLAVSGVSGALVILGPMMDLAHDRWVIEASWGLVHTDTDSVVHRDDLPQWGFMSAGPPPVCVAVRAKGRPTLPLQRLHPHALTTH